ncbi:MULTISPECIES: glycerate kinase type-2 family protein [Bradyrhizobium]|uniref:Glycerate kinase n=4 Tax=Bradyrhizobium TaxID=374 RepID=A0AAE5X8T4_9BRAD|nr:MULTISPECIES: glycerate kinase [Bradyrhizobium]MCG2628179.1 glycerate kinase [Bradyrhizobium zhengyangense]MCG2643298.1 glycerate kinase [Bradyrhizobium zhengyangense]MCG2670388.1 glycerate kinase [Bradyrhizobium zhengyangense]MDN4985877.1 glycerate kinase [Bradyrhizobium sp. WYCCWR 13022]MDN5002744.1 glycerate kinase [Bradyrhizobium sp. WYCCWR 12677]
MSAVWTDARARSLLRQLFDAAIASADPRIAVTTHLPPKPSGRCIVVGAGKASAAMAAVVDAAWPDVELSGVVVTRHGHAVPAGGIEVLEASHPVPDHSSEAAALRMLDAVRGLTKDDLVLALMSGGGSALMALPAPPMTLADKQAVNRALLASGATIAEMNVVRKHLSAIKGGRLALAARPARLLTLVISDIPGDDPAAIASGPTLPDASTKANAREIVRRFGIKLPDSAQAVLDGGQDTAKPGDIAEDVRIIAAPLTALDAAAQLAKREGLSAVVLGDAIEGEARELGTMMAGIARSVAQHGHPVKAPAVLLSGGETTVSIGHGRAGRGGRNTEFLLGLAVALDGAAGIWAIAGDSDGIDGTEDAAGALVTPDTLHRAAASQLDARALLTAHDSYTFFERLGDLVRTGPTLTNVNDIRAVLIAPTRQQTS